MTAPTDQDAALRDAVRELRENLCAWTGDAIVKRMLVAQLDYAETAINEQRWERARGALQSLQAAIRAAGASLWSG